MTQQSKIQNQETQVPKSPAMNDRDFLNDILTTEKYMTSSYSIALNEASHESLYQDLAAIMNETQDSQRHLFNVMFEKGWYSFDAAQQNSLQQSFQQFTGYNNQLPSGGLTQ
ncbi:spore coat protein [Bacillus sp. FJAT-44742]|uniref:spore coat protein n=1 Tax=Bacillus sp. FJAT-44742 TaxID=2014005 RepID=UPI000C239F84|nr:spore coat protein [Bacillus sp. FJAT-44742]